MKKIEIAEDDVYMIAELLASAGYAAVRAYSGTEALLLAEREKPDLVILDLMLPGKSGEEVLPKLSRQCPVIILSAKADVGGKVKNLNAGAADYITKPFDNDELLARIAVQLRRGDGQGDLRRVAPRPFENHPAPVTGNFAGAARGAYRQMLARPKLQIGAPPKIAAGKRELKQKNKDCKTNRANSATAAKNGAQPVKAARNPLKRCAIRKSGALTEKIGQKWTRLPFFACFFAREILK